MVGASVTTHPQFSNGLPASVYLPTCMIDRGFWCGLHANPCPRQYDLPSMAVSALRFWNIL